MALVKDKKCIKYFALAGVILLCLYSNVLARFFNPIFDDIYYGNLTKMFEAVVGGIIWGVEVGLIILACKKFSIEIFTSKEQKGNEMPIWRVILLFVLTILPMIVISACLTWKVKIVYALGERVTVMTLLCNVAEIVSYAVRMILMIMFIACVQKGFDMIVKTKYPIPFGAIWAFLTFGLIDFFVFSMDLRLFYLLVSMLYGIIYLVADKRLCITWILCYLIYLL